MLTKQFVWLPMLAAAVLCPSEIRAEISDTVWVWNSACPKPSAIAIRVRLDSTTLYRGSIPICRWDRQFGNGRISLQFVSPRALVWYGYRSDEADSTRDRGDTTAAETPLDIDVWQAGGEVFGVLLGITAHAPDGMHMNAVHLVQAGRRGATTLAPGLVLETWPIKSAGVP